MTPLSLSLYFVLGLSRLEVLLYVDELMGLML